jgi:CarboxypepD_reg-like domain/Outer membrane protein beta-barrel family
MKIFSLFFILLFGSIGFAQNIKFDGVVLDNKAVALEMANVMAIHSTTKTMDAYCITNDKGRFSLNLKPNTKYVIKVSFIGFKPLEINIETVNSNITKNLVIEEGNILNEVEIIREMPVSIKGDTIQYNADSFKTGTEKKLGDVLKKLPGVTVNADGEVEVEGKKVQKLMVEGKDFFDGDTKLGVKNIPADAIDKVQVLRNFNEVGAMKGLGNDQDNVAMNIKLKSGKKNFWFGDITAGTGVGHPESRYIINPKLFYYSPKYSLNFITNFNNIGELPLTVQDYFKMTGGFKKMMAKGGSNFNISSNDLGISLLRNNRAKDIETKFGATNFAYNPTKQWSISGFAILSASKTELETISQNTILANNLTTKTKDNSLQNSNLGLYKLSSSLKPNAKLQLDYDVLGKFSKQTEISNLYRESIIGNENIGTKKEQNPTTINQNVDLYYTKNDKNIFAISVQHLYQDENPFYNANLQNQAFNLNGYISGQNRNDLTQNRFVKTNKTDAKLDYYYMVTPKSNINLTIGNTFSKQNFDSHIFQILNGGSRNDLTNTDNNNQVKYVFNDAFVGLHYKILSGKFTFTPGVSFHSYQTANEQVNTNFSQNFTRILPDLFVLYQLKKAETLTYNFAITNDFTDINQLAAGYVLSNFNSLFRGNPFLENATSQTHTLRYFKYNMFNFENIFANISYSKKQNAVKTNATFVGIDQVSSPYNSNFADETLSGMANYGRSFYKYYKAAGNVNFNWSKFNNIQNNLPALTESFTRSFEIQLATNFKQLPNIELSYNYTVNKYNGLRFITEKPAVKLDYFFLKSFSFITEYEFYDYYNTDRTVKNQYAFLTASLNYQKKESKFEYKIEATNLLNTNSLNDDNFTQFRTSTSQYTVQPRYIIFSMKYNL